MSGGSPTAIIGAALAIFNNQVGSAGLVMAVVGGAAVTPLTAAVADGVSLRAAFATVPTACFLL